MVKNKKRKLSDSFSKYSVKCYNRVGIFSGNGRTPIDPIEHVKIVTGKEYGNSSPSNIKKPNHVHMDITSAPEYDLERFKIIQEKYFDIALRELRNGRRKTNWTLYMFPQIRGLRINDIDETYSISCIEEAIKYYNDESLKRYLKVISLALFYCNGNNPESILGKTDAMKVKSCMTLFHEVDPQNQIFINVLDKYYHGELDEKTLDILK